MSETPVIATERLTMRFGDVVAVDDVSLEVAAGEFFSLLGPSGCGKTTLLRTIAGFEAPTSGRLLLEGRDVSAVPPYRRNVNTVFQHYALFPHLNVFDNVAFGPRSKRLAVSEVERRVAEILAIVRLTDFAQRRPDQLSGGQRQRVALARALVNLPSALLLDEPLSALDLKLRQAMQVELKRIQREVGIAFVFVTHDQQEALTMSDRIALMNEGRIEQVGTPEEIYRRPATAFAAGFVGVANLLRATVVKTSGDAVVVRIEAQDEIAIPCPGGSLIAGQSTRLMVRPERVVLATDPPGGNVFAISAKLEGRTFHGPMLRCTLRDEAGNQLIADVAADMERNSWDLGRVLWAHWRPSDVHLLPSD